MVKPKRSRSRKSKLSQYLAPVCGDQLLKLQEEQNLKFTDPHILRAINEAKKKRKNATATATGSNDTLSTKSKSSVDKLTDVLKEAEKYLHGMKPKKGHINVTYKMHRNTSYRSPTNSAANKRTCSVAYPENKAENTVAGYAESCVDDNQNDLNENLAEYEHYINECLPKKKKNVIDWHVREGRLTKSFEDEREKLFEQLIQSEHPSGFCCNCDVRESKIVCKDCKQFNQLCVECDEFTHAHQPFHDRCGFSVNGITSLLPTQTLNESGEIITKELLVPMNVVCQCGSAEIDKFAAKELVSVITFKGRYDLFSFICTCQVCKTTFDALTLTNIIRSNYWPLTIKRTSCLIDTGLLDLLVKLQEKMPGASEYSMLSALELISNDNDRCSSLNVAAFRNSWKEYKICKHNIDIIQRKNWMECPCCSIEQHSCHVDGNSKLYRYNSAGKKSDGKAYFKDLFICDDKDVEETVNQVYSRKQGYKKIINGCGNSVWKAARNVKLSKSKLDVTGLNYCACRHCFAQKAVNMKQGEIFAYPYHLQSNFMSSNKVQFYWSDVACKYHPWLKNVDLKLSQSMVPALSVMHAKAHSSSCQILWDGRMTTGTGLTTGEEVEQINSYLSRLGNSTKHQNPEVRIDTITFMVLQWNKRKTLKLIDILRQKYVNAKTRVSSISDELLAKFSLNDMVYCEDTIKKWKQELISWAKKNTFISTIAVSIEEEFLILYFSAKPRKIKLAYNANHFLHQDLLQVIDMPILQKEKNVQLERLKSIHNTIDCSDFSCAVLTLSEKIAHVLRSNIESILSGIADKQMRVSKLADSCKMRTRIRLKMSEEKKQLIAAADIYNEFAKKCNISIIDKTKMDEGEFPWMRVTDADGVSLKFKRDVVVMWELLHRTQEEVIILEKEMMNFLDYYQSKMELLKEDINKLESSENSSQVIMTQLIKGFNFAKKQYENGHDQFSKLRDMNNETLEALEKNDATTDFCNDYELQYENNGSDIDSDDDDDNDDDEDDDDHGHDDDDDHENGVEEETVK